MQKKLEDKRKEAEKRLEGGCGGGGGAEQKPVSSRQSSTTATPRGVRYTSYTVTATSNVGSTVVTTVDGIDTTYRPWCSGCLCVYVLHDA